MIGEIAWTLKTPQGCRKSQDTGWTQQGGEQIWIKLRATLPQTCLSIWCLECGIWAVPILPIFTFHFRQLSVTAEPRGDKHLHSSSSGSFTWAIREAVEIPRQALCFLFCVGNVLSFQAKQKCILHSFPSSTNNSIWKKANFSLFVDTSISRKRKYKRQKSAKELQKGIFRKKQWQNAQRVGFTHLSLCYSYSSEFFPMTSWLQVWLASWIPTPMDTILQYQWEYLQATHSPESVNWWVPVIYVPAPAALTHTGSCRQPAAFPAGESSISLLTIRLCNLNHTYYLFK